VLDSAALKPLIARVTRHSSIDSKLLRAWIAAMLLTLAACGGGGGEDAPPPTGLQPTLTSIQANIFTPSCAKSTCHTGAMAPFGLNLDPGQSYMNLFKVMSPQFPYERVNPGMSDASLLILKLEGSPLTGDRMPADGFYLQQADVNVIRQWIDSCSANACP